MAHPVSNWIHLLGNAQARKEWDRIQNELHQHTQTDMLSQTDFLRMIKDTRPDNAAWPKWVVFEFSSPEILSFTSANWPVFEIQDLLTWQLRQADTQAITILEWQNWPQACGVRLALTDQEKLIVFESSERQDNEALHAISPDQDTAFHLEEASTEQMWSAIERCHQAVRSAALNAGSRISPASFSS